VLKIINLIPKDFVCSKQVIKNIHRAISVILSCQPQWLLAHFVLGAGQFAASLS
jgi:hypothetical protein